MVFLGYMVCGVLCGYVADRYGRWKVRRCFVWHISARVWFLGKLDEINAFVCKGGVWRLYMGIIFFSADFILSIVWLVHLPALYGGLRCRSHISRVRLRKYFHIISICTNLKILGNLILGNFFFKSSLNSYGSSLIKYLKSYTFIHVYTVLAFLLDL